MSVEQDETLTKTGFGDARLTLVENRADTISSERLAGIGVLSYGACSWSGGAITPASVPSPMASIEQMTTANLQPEQSYVKAGYTKKQPRTVRELDLFEGVPLVGKKRA